MCHGPVHDEHCNLCRSNFREANPNSTADAPTQDYVFIICDKAADKKSLCPYRARNIKTVNKISYGRICKDCHSKDEANFGLALLDGPGPGYTYVPKSEPQLNAEPTVAKGDEERRSEAAKGRKRPADDIEAKDGSTDKKSRLRQWIWESQAATISSIRSQRVDDVLAVMCISGGTLNEA